MKDFLNLTLLFVLIFQCSERQRLNPIDPKNPDTGGRLVGLSISSEFDNIYLSWKQIEVNDLKGYNIYRKSDAENLFQHIKLMPPDSSEFKDSDLPYRRIYSYFVTAITPVYESVPSETLAISPGPTHIWMTDVNDRRIYSISHDGLHIRETISVDGYPWDVFIHSTDRSIWYSDRLYGKIFRMNGGEKLTYSSATSWWDPVDMTFDESRNILWVADKGGKVLKIATVGQDSVVELEGESFREPVSVSVDKTSGCCLMVDSGARAVFELSEEQNDIRQLIGGLQRPTCVAVNETDGSYWVADSTRLLKLHNDGSIDSIVKDYFRNIVTIAVNKKTNEIWVYDAGTYNSDSRLIRFDNRGNKILEIVGFQHAESIAVNTYDNSCAIADYTNGSLTRISADGQILSKLHNFYYLHGLHIEYEQE